MMRPSTEIAWGDTVLLMDAHEDYAGLALRYYLLKLLRFDLTLSVDFNSGHHPWVQALVVFLFLFF